MIQCKIPRASQVILVPLLIAMAVLVSAAETEISRVTLFVEGMIKSRGGVT